tara:strand:- start:489 stop:1634 length:1146 start_codon:yes stop_codon:yes gene_type:complete
MNCTRRSFIQGSLATLFIGGLNLPLLASSIKKNLIIISLRGGMDGLTAVPVIGDPKLKKYRSELLLDKRLKLTSDFGLHPKLSTLHNLWNLGKASIVHATNIPYNQRSHFDGQNLMESGGITPYHEKTGWLGRGLKTANLDGSGLALTLPMPLLLRGIKQNNNFYPSHKSMPRREIVKILKSAYEGASEEQLLNVIDVILNRPITMQGGNQSLDSLSKRASKILLDPLGPRVAVFDIEGFDTHAAQGTDEGEHANNLQDIDLIIKNLYEGLGAEFDNTLILTLTEFGRTVEQNGGYGTDHGYGTAILMAGGLLKKSQVYSDWPGLKKNQLFENRDLLSTLDSRGVYASAMASVFDLEFDQIKNNVFWGESIPNLSEDLFKV